MDTPRVKRSLSDRSHKRRSSSVNLKRQSSLTEIPPTTDPVRKQQASSPFQGTVPSACPSKDLPTRHNSDTTLYGSCSNTSEEVVELTRCRPGLPPPDLVIVDRGKETQVKIEHELSSGSCMKMIKRQDSFCVKAAPFKKKNPSFFFTSQVIKAIDKETMTKQFTLYLFSMTLKDETYYLHPIYSSDHCDAETLQLRLAHVSRDQIITSDGIPESGQEFFFIKICRSSCVFESLAYQGYYLSFENTQEIVARKPSEPVNLPHNYDIEIFPAELKQYRSSKIFSRIIPCLKPMHLQ